MARKRKVEQAKGRAAVVAAARRLFTDLPYGQVTLRQIAAAAGCTTGGIYSNFSTKAAIWREVMGKEPPTDSLLTRNAGDLEQALRTLIAVGQTADEIPASLAQALVAAETMLARLEGPNDAGLSHEPEPEPEPDAEPRLITEGTADVMVGGILTGPARIELVSDILSLADARGWLAPSFAETAESLTDLCRRLVDHQDGQTDDEEVYMGAVEACALSMVIAVNGVRPRTAA